MQRLYKISGCGYDYSFCEFVCPTLTKKINISVPDEIISNELINSDKLDELYNTGLIDLVVYETILSGDIDDTAYFVAEEIEEGQYRCYRLSYKDNRLIGRLPNWFDEHKEEYRWPICFLIFVLFIYFFSIF